MAETLAPYVDCHCHLADEAFHGDITEVIERARGAGVGACVVVSENAPEFFNVLTLCEQYPHTLYPCLGVHPVQGNESVRIEHMEQAEEFIHQHHEKIVGIGEIGLDFTPWLCGSEVSCSHQREVFQRQLQVAQQYDLPVNVHSRSAARECVQLLKQAGMRKVLLHNFAGRLSVAMEAVSLGYFMSFPPRIVEKSERKKVLEQVPLENICLETDSPALAAVKGERNEPSHIGLVCNHIAEIKKVDPQVVQIQTFNNTCKIFPCVSKGC